MKDIVYPRHQWLSPDRTKFDRLFEKKKIEIFDRNIPDLFTTEAISLQIASNIEKQHPPQNHISYFSYDDEINLHYIGSFGSII